MENRQHTEKDKSSTREETVTVHNLNLHSDNHHQYYLIFHVLKQTCIAKALTI